MKWLRLPVALLSLACLSCASDGGPVGTGISGTSAISGNVVDVQTDSSAASADTQTLPAIQVSVDGYPDATTADSGGNFELRGAFSGSVTLRFTVPQFQVTQQLDVPAGSAVVLQDIELQPTGVVAQAARQLNFFGTIDLVDCADGTLLVHEHDAHGMQFLVRVDDQTTFQDAAGGSRTCAALAAGTTVAIEGSIAYATDRTITASVVTLASHPPPPPPAQLSARFDGAIAGLDCVAGIVVVDDSEQRTRIQLTTQTQIGGAMGALACADLQLGDVVHGQGQIALRAPGTIVATRLVVTGAAHGGQSLRFVGFVAALDCVSGALQVRDVRTTVDVRLSAATVIGRPNGQRLACGDIQLGDRVMGMGTVAAGEPDVLDATQITVMHHGPGGPMGH